MNAPIISHELFERAKLGEARATDLVLTELRAALVSRAQEYLRKYPDDADADSEDVAQTALVWVWQNLSKAETPEKLVTMALKATLNDARDVRKANYRRRARVVASSPLTDSASNLYQTTELGIPLGSGNYFTPQGDSHDGI